MNPIVIQISLYLLSFLAIWLGAGWIVESVSRLAKGLRLPAFTVSFFVLGLLTSLPELIIGLTAVAEGKPEIFVGNLIGATVVLVLLVIPLLSLANKGLKTPRQLSKRLLILLLVVLFTPALLTGDRRVDNWEGIVCIALYCVLFFFFSREQNIVERITQSFHTQKTNWLVAMLKICGGILLLIVASRQIVDSTQYFAQVLGIAPFFVSLIVVSLGTNIPELSLIARTLLGKKQDIALADYFGSASANTLLFGILSLFYPAAILVPNQFFHRFIFIAIGLTVFYFFMRSGKRLSWSESLILLLIYIAFVVTEFMLAH